MNRDVMSVRIVAIPDADSGFGDDMVDVCTVVAAGLIVTVKIPA